MIKKLIIAPHIDDDVLGCGGIMDKDTHVLYVGNGHSAGIISNEDRLKEADAVQQFLGHSYSVLDNPVDHYEIFKVLNDFEQAIKEYKPKELYVPHLSYNQDHKTVYEAVMTATRLHDKNWFVKKIMLYEQPQVFLWNNTNREFKPNYFVPIDIDRKIVAYKMMPSQVRSYRSPETIRSMAQIRGKQSGYEFAEAFEILRWVE